MFRHIFSWLSLAFIFISFNADAFEFGRYDVKAMSGHNDCINQTCTLQFKESYDSTPLVFLMDTVEFRNENDQPSSLVILNVTRDSVTFQQKIPPATKSNNPHLSPRPMFLIDYLVIEKGVHRLNDETMLIADTVFTNKHQYRFDTKQSGNFRGGWESINFQNIQGANSFPHGVTPGVIHQVQTRNNAREKGTDFWLTSTVTGVSNQQFKISLERSEVDGHFAKNNRPYPTEEEEIGFVAAYGSGELNGRKFQMGSQQTTNSIGKGEPVTIGCDTYANFGPFESIPVLIANKNSRQGNNGGWVRRCRMESDKASFMIDEDMDADAERGHVAERVGYFLFEKPFEVPSCDYVKSAAQTWKLADGEIDHEGRLTMAGNAAIYGAVPGRQVGFLPNRVEYSGNSGCPSGGCFGNADLMLDQKPEFTPFTPVAGNVIEPKNNRVVLAPGNYTEIKLDGKAHLVLSGGEYWIGNLNVSGKAVIEVAQKSVLNVNSASISGDNVRVNYSDNQPESPGNLYIIQHAPNGEIALSGGLISAYLVSHYSVSMSGKAYINGAVTAKFMSMSGNAQINGDLDGCGQPMTRQLVITPQTAYGLTCERMPITFEVQKSDGTVDTGFVGNMQVLPDSDPNSDTCWSATPNGICEPGSGSIPISGGQRVLYLQSQKVGDVNISAQVQLEQGKRLEALGGPYRFAPFGFRINGGLPASMIAGKKLDLKVEAVASQGASCSVIKDYGKASGEHKTLTLHSLRYVRPITQNVTPEINGQEVTTNSSHQTTLNFTNGVAYLPVQYFDAGELQFKLQDSEWSPKQCERAGCEDYQGDWKGMFGTAVIYSRPYTFALCDIISSSGKTDFSGTSTEAESSGFAKSGERFSVTVKPVAYPSFSHNTGSFTVKNASPSEVITTNNHWCKNYTTPNYYQVRSQYLDAPLALSIADKPHSPDQGTSGKLSGSLNHQFRSLGQASEGLVIDDLSWNEVGSLWLKAEGRYLGETINPGVGVIGRFYPAKFSLIRGQVRNAYSNFTYMEQAFKADFEIEAQNEQGESTRNYGLFHTGLQESFFIIASDSESPIFQPNDLTHRLVDLHPAKKGNWVDARFAVKQKDYVFKRVWHTTIKSEPDGPFLTKVGIMVVPRNDCTSRGCTNFVETDLSIYDEQGIVTKEGVQLNGLIDARYGRMTLEDAAGRNDSPIAIPLRVEYWDGARFITNKDDSVSGFDGQYYCRQVVTQSDTSVISTSDTQGEGQVKDGETRSGDFIARPTPGVNYREQVRFWQKLIADKPSQAVSDDGDIHCENGFSGSNEQPWLTYDWRGLGDENPSALVTFGVYRGNDRVIYRGEKGINTMLN